MAHRYLPYIHNQVLELADPTRDLSRKAMRERFRDKVKKSALTRTRAEETGKNALIRFAEVTDEDVEFSQ